MRLASASVLLSLALSGCVTNDDAGDAAFVTSAVPAVLGRKVRGAVELDVLTQIVQQYGREQLVEVLMDQPEFTEYWTHVIAEDLGVQYAAPPGFNNISPAQPPDCYNTAPVVALGDATAAANLATFLRGDVSVVADYGADFTMLDALRAGVLADDLIAPYRAFLFPLMTHLDEDKRFGQLYFDKAYLGREVECLACHSSTWSTTDDQDDPDTTPVEGWDRYAPVAFDLDGGLVAMPWTNAPSGYYWNNVLGAPALYTTHCAGCHGTDGQQDVGSADGDRKVLAQRVRTLSDAQLQGVLQHGYPPNMPAPNLTVAEEYKLGLYLRAWFGNPTTTQWFFREDTVSDASGIQPLGLADVCSDGIIPNKSLPSGTFHPVFSGSGYGTPSVFNLSRRLTSGASYDATTFFGSTTLDSSTPAYEYPLIPGAGNFAYAVSQRIVDNVTQEVWGERLTIGHGTERNEQASAMRTILAQQFMDEDWSLRGLVKSLVLSEHFNRRAPEDSLVGTTAYTLAMLFNPWAAADPDVGATGPQDDHNSPGDGVHRYTPDNLFWSVHHGLGWDAPELVPDAPGGFPSYDLRLRVGDYVSYYQPGYTEWNTAALTYWDEAVGMCPNLNSSTGEDWIDLLLDEAYLAPGTYTVEDLVQATRDRLLADPELLPDEEAHLLTLLDALGLGQPANLAVPLSGYTAADLAPFVRRYCGALLTTPDYLLGGLPLVDNTAGDWPALEVCLPGEPCGARDQCDYWADALADHGISWTTCNDTPPPGIAPHDPTDESARVSVEDELAAEHDYGTATDYDDEIATNLAAEQEAEALEDAWLEEALYQESVEEAARAEAVSGYAAPCATKPGGCVSVAAAWEAEMDALAAARATNAELYFASEPVWAGEDWSTLTERQLEREREANPGEFAVIDAAVKGIYAESATGDAEEEDTGGAENNGSRVSRDASSRGNSR